MTTTDTAFDEIVTDDVATDPILTPDAAPEPSGPRPPMLGVNARVVVRKGVHAGMGVIVNNNPIARTYVVVSDKGARFVALEDEVEAAPIPPRSDLPATFELPAWTDTGIFPPQFSVETALMAVKRANGGEVPDDLTTEDQIVAFCGVAAIPITFADIESALIFPHRRFASREYVRLSWIGFYEWCQKTGWLEKPVAKGKKK